MRFGVAILCRLWTEDRPAAGGVDHGLNGKFTTIGLYAKRTAAFDAGYCDLLTTICAQRLRVLPQSCVQSKARDAQRHRLYRKLC